MRRLVAIPVKTLAMLALLITGAVYVVAEAHRSAIDRANRDLAELEQKALSTQPSSFNQPITSTAKEIQAHPYTNPPRKEKDSDEQAAERQAAKIPAQKPPKNAAEGPKRQIVISISDRR